MMPFRAASSFEREMACTEAEWLRLLPAAIGRHAWRQEPGGASVTIGSGTLRLRWRVAQPRAIALLRMPRLLVGFRFGDVAAAERVDFMNRFDLFMQRGGG